jgi:hypothetical protein
VWLFGWHFILKAEIRFILIVAIAAALGSYIQVATSFTTYLGNARLSRRWLWWYVLRMPIGVSLSLLVYFAIRGGFFTTVSGGTDVNPFGVAALGGLVGMFSKHAADKLQDVFDELFKSERDRARVDKLEDRIPKIITSDPPTLSAGTGGTVTLRGTGFDPNATVTVNGKAHGAVVIDSRHVTLSFGAEELSAGVPLTIILANPGPGGGASAAFSIPVSGQPRSSEADERGRA